MSRGSAPAALGLTAVTLSAVASGCGRSLPPPSPEEIVAELAVARAGCARCHELPAARRETLAPAAGPPLAEAVRWRAADGGASWLRGHHGGDDAADLAAWLVALGTDAPPAQEVVLTEEALQRGERLARELACGACHAGAVFADLAARSDHARVAAFLASPGVRRPGLVHPALAYGEATDVAAWLLRAQRQEQPAATGFAWACFELRVRDEHLPDLGGLLPAATGIAKAISTAPATRSDHYVLRFEATLDVPAAGEWTFQTRSDDSSWLWIDDVLVVQNEALAPARRRDGRITLTAGPHALRVVHSEAEGDAVLEVRWRGPGVAEQELPAARATARPVRLAPPPQPAAPAAEAIARGRAAARARRCDACHAFDDAAFAAMPPPPPARPFAELGGGPCPSAPGAAGLAALARAAGERAFDARARLEGALRRDGCLACHARDGRGGLPPVVRAGLTGLADLGDEGRLPPDLTGVGRRLRADWLEHVLATGHRTRPYLQVRMPALGAARARDYATWFAAADGAPPVDAEPVFRPELAERGRQVAGVGGRNCVTCHPVHGEPALGPQGMDLALQHRRLRPAWLREWLAAPQRLRPGTRMPPAWPHGGDEARAEIDAVLAWLSLGDVAPLPPGVGGPAAGLLLVPRDRPRLHGAFLAGVSARCLCVGTPERTHLAWDLATPRLAWLWRGAFVDAAGSWSGRGGRLLRPAGEDHVVLDDLVLAERPGGASARRLLGQRRTADGYPVLRIAVGDSEYEDEARPRLVAGGSEVVRTLTCVRGTLAVAFAAAAPPLSLLVDGAPPRDRVLGAGDAIEVVYRW